MIQIYNVDLNFYAFSISQGYLFDSRVLSEVRLVLPQTHTHMITKTYFKTKEHCKVKFTFTQAAETVAVVGLNNDWETSISLAKKKDGTFSCDVNLPKDSQHEFKYLVNGADWQNEADADAEVQNVYGSANSVITL